jgi:hypothetical protein
MSEISHFKLRHAIVGYTVALVFALNGWLANVSDASFAAGGSSFAIVTCLGGEAPGQLPGQNDHTTKCSCSLSCCCAGSSLARTSNGTDVGYPAVSVALPDVAWAPIVRDFRTDRPLHLRSPPAAA